MTKCPALWRVGFYGIKVTQRKQGVTSTRDRREISKANRPKNYLCTDLILVPLSREDRQIVCPRSYGVSCQDNLNPGITSRPTPFVCIPHRMPCKEERKLGVRPPEANLAILGWQLLQPDPSPAYPIER